MTDTLDYLAQTCLNISDQPSIPASNRLPAEILIEIFELLCFHHAELYAPLICSQVCRFWRQIIKGIPELWSVVDISRGLKLTELWLTNSRNVELDVRLWNRPPDPQILTGLSICLSEPCDQLNIDPSVEAVKLAISRWRSLDIAFSCISYTSKVIEYLGDLRETVKLDSLTIGPMGRTSLLMDNSTVEASHPGTSFRFADPAEAKSLFEQINVQPSVLRIDTYPIAFSPVVFSPRLTELEVLTGNYHHHIPELDTWHEILLSTPQLVKLRLWSARHWGVDPARSLELSPLHLPDLDRLELSGAFIILSPLFTKSTLPMLDYLSLDFVGDSISIPQQLAKIAEVSPALTRLHVGSMSFSPDSFNPLWWTKTFEAVRSLQILTLFELEWLEAASALTSLASAVPHTLSHVDLEGIWDIDRSTLAQLQAPDSGLPRINITNCAYNEPTNDCPNLDHSDTSCSCRSGSNYSDNSSYEFEPGFPPSELDSEGSEISYGEDEGSEMATMIQK
ncbi:hypothetical protein FRC07_015126 [Ceratobasidium sp. 392]|nr:hypothetical protein FRC07_015126 [Ceratobasidium sp. 392]